MRTGDGVAVASVAAVLVAAAVASLRWKRTAEFVRHWSRTTNPTDLPQTRKRVVSEGVLGAIGNMPLIRIRSLSDATGCEIYGKAEFLNPGGSVKDRVAAKIVEEALQSGALRVGGVVTEGSAVSTAVSLAMVAVAYGCRCHVVLPDNAAIEKETAKDISVPAPRVRKQQQFSTSPGTRNLKSKFCKSRYTLVKKPVIR